MAAKANGELCSHAHKDAVFFCVTGALFRAAHEQGYKSYEAATLLLTNVMGGGTLWMSLYNDKKSTTKQDVLKKLDAAIALTS